MDVLEKIPTFLTVGVLVFIFIGLRRHIVCARLTLWAIGWGLVFTHFLAQLLEPGRGAVNIWLQAIDMGALQAAAVAFLVSVSSVVEDTAKRNYLLLILGLPSVVFMVLYACSVRTPWPYVVCLIACFAVPAVFFVRGYRKLTPYLGVIISFCFAADAWAVRGTLHNSLEQAAIVLLALGFGLPGVFICRNYWRLSPAILTICGGFLFWGASYPAAFVIHELGLKLMIPTELWNVPKLFVAFGMILTVVEEKSRTLAGMQQRAEALNRQLERFSGITSRLLSGTKPESLCTEIATAITEVAGFDAAAIYLEDPDHILHIAGASGTPAFSLLKLQNGEPGWTLDYVKTLCARGGRVGRNTFLLPGQENQELLIPLCSRAGGYVGCLQLSAADLNAINPLDVSRIELLAADLAVAVEIKVLWTQLVCSEKLAALGQLVAGVAHELNNPLTVIMGYGELMGDEIKSPGSSDKLTRLLNETRRMKRIIERLLRFSRQSTRDSKMADLVRVVQEVIEIREHYTHTRNVHVDVDLVPGLPLLAVNEDELKQVLLNVMNNASDALEGVADKRIAIRAFQDGKQAVIEVEDSGPGFANLSRALDAFYTTKPAGKGTGLGLSVCHGIAKENGGDFRIQNLKPNGARVTIELPLIGTRADFELAIVAQAAAAG
jgi:signal transduction histidine kinase